MMESTGGETGFKHYKASGSVHPLVFAIAVVGVLVVFAASWLYQALVVWIPYIYISAFVAIGFMLIVAAAAYVAAHFGKSRNALVGGLVGLLVGVAGWGGSHYFARDRLLNDAAEAASARTGKPVAESKKTLSKAFGFGKYIDYKVKSGWQLSGRRGQGGTNLNGFWVWAIWGIEALAIILAGIFGGFIPGTAPFCENCEKWMHSEPLITRDDFDADEIAAIKNANNLAQLVGVRSSPKQMPSPVQLRYSRNRCDQCDDRTYLTVERVWEELDDNDQPEEKSEVLHSDIELREGDLGKLLLSYSESVISNLD